MHINLIALRTFFLFKMKNLYIYKYHNIRKTNNKNNKNDKENATIFVFFYFILINRIRNTSYNKIERKQYKNNFKK